MSELHGMERPELLFPPRPAFRSWEHSEGQTDPAVAGIDRGGMPVFGGPPTNLTADEIATVVEYLKTLP